MLYNILKDQWQTIEIDRIRSITQETEFSQMAELLYDMMTRDVLRKITTPFSSQPLRMLLGPIWFFGTSGKSVYIYQYRSLLSTRVYVRIVCYQECSFWSLGSYLNTITTTRHDILCCHGGKHK